MEKTDWTPPPARYTADSLVPLRIEGYEKELRAQAKAAGGRWNPEKQLWFVQYGKIAGIRPLLNDYLNRYSTVLGYEKLEDLILELSGILRESNGVGASITALKNAEYLNVNFFMLVNDLLLDLWDRFADMDDSALPQAVIEFRVYLQKARINELHRESIVWFKNARAAALLYCEIYILAKDADELTEAISSIEDSKLREHMSQMRQNKLFDRRLFPTPTSHHSMSDGLQKDNQKGAQPLKQDKFDKHLKTK